MQDEKAAVIAAEKAKGVELFEASAEHEGETVEVVFRKPSQAQLARQLKGMRQQDPLRAAERLIYDVRVWPSEEELAALFKRKPGIVLGIAGEVMEAAGGTTAFEARRL